MCWALNKLMADTNGPERHYVNPLILLLCPASERQESMSQRQLHDLYDEHSDTTSH